MTRNRRSTIHHVLIWQGILDRNRHRGQKQRIVCTTRRLTHNILTGASLLVSVSDLASLNFTHAHQQQ